MAKDTETERGKDSILPPAPKKSFLDGASNRLARTIAQIRTGHWLCAPYLKTTRKNSDDEVSDRCWWCGQWRMSHTHVFLLCMHQSLESARTEIRDRPDEDGRIPTRPTSIGQLLGKAKWEKPLADWIVATGVGLLGPGKQDYGRNELTGMTGGDVSHSSKRRLDTCTKGIARDFFSLGLYFSHVQLFCICFYLDVYLCLFPFKWGVKLLYLL
jgi:hypothetical protein